MSAHLRFIRRFKSHLKLALNAAEDLLINGVKPPSDRGTCRHLLAKIDRPTIQRVLSRDPVKSNMPERAAFLAGIVRIDPDLGLLLEYLDALSSSPDKRDAARAFSVTVDRIDFTSISQAQLAKVLSVISHTFGGHDRVQVLFGLLDSESFRAALDRSLGAVDPALAGAFGPLSAVHRAVVQGVALAAEEDADEKQSQLLHAGVVELLAAPDHVLRAYPEPVRARLAELAMAGRIDEGTARQATRRLLETLPTKDDKYLPLRLARAEQLLRTGDDDDARALIAKIAKTNPALEWAVRRNEALSWRQVGRVTVSGPDKDDGTLRRGFWLDESCFAWVRTAPPDQAGRAVAEAVLQADLQMAGVVPVLAHGLGKDGTVWVAIPAIGDPITSAAFSQLAIRDALIVAYDGVSLLGGLARAGIELPDLQRSRFLALRTASQLADLDPSSAPRLLLASLSGAVARDSGFAAIAHTKLAAKWCREVIFGANRASLSRDIRTKLGGQAPIPIMLRAITTALARL